MNPVPLKLWLKLPGDGPSEIWTLEPHPEGVDLFHFAPFAANPDTPNLEIAGFMRKGASPEPGAVPLQSSMANIQASKEQHLEVIQKALNEIGAGELEKVVLSRSEFWESDVPPELVFRSKCETYRDSFVYLMHHPEAGVWMGASPELLLQKRGRSYETVSLAGTQKVQATSWSEKEIHEQALVTDFIKEVVKINQAQDVNVSETHDRTYGVIKHLESRISFSSEADMFYWLNALHPTPAVGGEPRKEALAFIAENEIIPRGYYAGYVGWSRGHEADFFVNLRCMRCFRNGYQVFAGGGIVAGSDPQSEWEETQAKIATIQSQWSR